MDHIAHLGGISPCDWQTKPCEQAEKAAGMEHLNLACWGLAFLPADCAAWLLGRTADRPANVFEASAGLFPMITGREPPFEAKLEWLQFTYTADWAGAYLAPVFTVLTKSAVAEGDDLFPVFLEHLRRQYPEVYGLVVDMAWAHERRELLLGEGGGLSSINSVNNSIKLGSLRRYIS